MTTAKTTPSDALTPEIKAQVKQQRLTNLAMQYYEQQMTLAAYAANGKTQQAGEVHRIMDELEVSYAAIAAM